ncbi:hypothetical protein [Pseudomonas japonica]|uniref:hypothetical protein n=1 Tax=Pseudomonas japonica TaxID=256466 RepID=UPI0015E2DFD8|nr:hypothetical protein [Pseudomonas japonica]MBA1245546.1 hypothetical protein [Pseudomonas japonica]
MDQVAHGLALLRPLRLSPLDFKALIRQRGWRMADAAVRWNVRPETLSRIAADPSRETRWDDLVRALPQLTRRERAAATAARLALCPPRPRARAGLAAADDPSTSPSPAASPPAPLSWADDEEEDLDDSAYGANGFRYRGYVGVHSELVVVREIGSFAPEGAVLVVSDTRLGVNAHAEPQEEYCCESPSGLLQWLTPDEMDDWVVSTGKTRSVY